MDEGFIKRIYRTAAWVMPLVLLFLVSLGAFRVAVSVLAGSVLSLLLLRLFEWLVTAYLSPGRKPPAWLILKVALLKLPVLAGMVYLVVRSGWFHLPAFTAGVASIQAIIFLKAVGLFLVQREEDRKEAGPVAPGRASR